MSERLVLVADPDPEIHRLIEAALGVQQFRTVSAANGEEVLTIARTVHPELIVADLGIAPVDGFATLGRLKSDPATAAIPVLAVTREPHPELQQQVRSAGFDALLIKPVTATTLADVGRLLVERAALLREHAAMLRHRGEAVRARAAEVRRAAEETRAAAVHARDSGSAPATSPRCRRCGSDAASQVVRTTRSSVTYRCGVCQGQWRLTFKNVPA